MDAGGDRLNRLLSLWGSEVSGLKPGPFQSQLKGQDPFAALDMLAGSPGRVDPGALLRLLQLGSAVGQETGQGQNDMVMQLIGALLQPQGHDMAALRGR